MEKLCLVTVISFRLRSTSWKDDSTQSGTRVHQGKTQLCPQSVRGDGIGSDGYSRLDLNTVGHRDTPVQVPTCPSDDQQYTEFSSWMLLVLGEFLQRSVVSVVHLVPHRFYSLSSLQSRFSISGSLLGPLTGETLVDLSFDVVATTCGFVEKTSCMTLIERIHDLLAICLMLAVCCCATLAALWRLIHTDIVLGVQMRMHSGLFFDPSPELVMRLKPRPHLR